MVDVSPNADDVDRSFVAAVLRWRSRDSRPIRAPTISPSLSYSILVVVAKSLSTSATNAGQHHVTQERFRSHNSHARPSGPGGWA